MSREQYLANKNLKELHGSGYEMVKGEPDIRGWKIINIENQVIGKVVDLLFDISSLKVRYLAVKLDGKPINLISRDVLIPIGLAELDKDKKLVLFPDLTVGHLASLPVYKKGDVTVQTERAIRTVFAGTEGVRAGRDIVYDDMDEFYNHDHFNEDKFYRPATRPSQPGNIPEGPIVTTTQRRIIQSPDTTSPRPEARMNKTVSREQTAVSDKPVREEGFAPFQEGSIEFVEHSEVPVISKEPRVVEEVSISKEVKERDEKVKDTVRKTKVDVEKLNEDDLSDDDQS